MRKTRKQEKDANEAERDDLPESNISHMFLSKTTTRSARAVPTKKAITPRN